MVAAIIEEEALVDLHNRFDNDGFVILDDALSVEEVDEVLDQIRVVVCEALSSARLSTDGSLEECYLRLKEEAPQLKSHCYDVFGQLDAVVRAAGNERSRQAVRAILGGVAVVEGLQIRIGDPSNDRFYPLHQELGLFSHRNFTAWSPLIDLGGSAGGLTLVPGSHKQGLLPHRHLAEFGNYHGVDSAALKGMEPVAVAPSVGQVVVFHPYLVHGSVPNQSDRVTWTIIGRYNDIANAPYLRDADAPRRIPRPAEAS